MAQGHADIPSRRADLGPGRSRWLTGGSHPVRKRNGLAQPSSLHTQPRLHSRPRHARRATLITARDTVQRRSRDQRNRTQRPGRPGAGKTVFSTAAGPAGPHVEKEPSPAHITHQTRPRGRARSAGAQAAWLAQRDLKKARCSEATAAPLRASRTTRGRDRRSTGHRGSARKAQRANWAIGRHHQGPAGVALWGRADL